MKISIKREQNDACIGYAGLEKIGTQFKKYIFIAVAGMLALSSCSNDDNEQAVPNAPRQKTFTAGFDNDAKTLATLLDKTASFNASDQISILSANNANTAFTTSSGGSEAFFSGTATNDSEFYAVYPYTSGLTLGGDVIEGAVIPTDQWNPKWGKGEDGCWDPSAPIAYATTTNKSLTFHHACAILKIQISGTFGGVEISADQALAGTFRLDTKDGTLTPTSGSTTVTAGRWDGTEPMILFAYIDVYIAVAPGTYTNFKVHVQDFVGQKQEKTESEVTFEKGKIYDFGSFDDLM